MSPIQQNWINFKTHFCTAHRELEETGELTMEDAGYHRANLVNDMVAQMSGLKFPYPSQEPAYTPIKNYAPTIASTIQPSPVANAIIDAASNILPHIMTRMQQIQHLLMQILINQAGGGGQTSNHNTHCPPNRQAATKPRQGQPHKLLPDFANKYVGHTVTVHTKVKLATTKRLSIRIP